MTSRPLWRKLAKLGRIVSRVDEAWSFLVAIGREQSNLSFAWTRANITYQTPQLMEHYLEGFRKAGLDGA
jgi:hypothetical protein